MNFMLRDLPTLFCCNNFSKICLSRPYLKSYTRNVYFVKCVHTIFRHGWLSCTRQNRWVIPGVDAVPYRQWRGFKSSRMLRLVGCRVVEVLKRIVTGDETRGMENRFNDVEVSEIPCAWRYWRPLCTSSSVCTSWNVVPQSVLNSTV
jgi:hypothetical protein